MVLAGRRDVAPLRAQHYFDGLASQFALTEIPIDETIGRMAVACFERYGKGRHPARLNFGDCLSYACAKAAGARLLFKGEDFAKTDVNEVMIGSFEETTGTMTPQSALPIGPLVDAHAAKRPERITLKGRWTTLAPLDAHKHAISLYDGSNGEPERERVWTYLFDGPYANLQEFRASLELKARSEDPLFFAVIDNASGRAVGYQTLMRIDPANRVIEVGNIHLYPGDAAHGRRDRSPISLRQAMSSTTSAIAATSGSATTSTRPRSARPRRFGFAFEGSSAST